jgi:hypothetical protein
MTDWRTRLREADPDRGAELRPDAVERVRARVIAAVNASAPRPRQAPSRQLALVATLSLAVLAAVGAAWQAGLRGTPDLPLRADRLIGSGPATPGLGDDASSTAGRQQLHFATPGGTRIIWVFDPAFEIKGMLP